MVITDAAARFRDVLHAGFPRPLHIIAERKKCVRAHGHTCLGGNPYLFFLGSQGFRLDLTFRLPLPFRQYILGFRQLLRG